VANEKNVEELDEKELEKLEPGDEGSGGKKKPEGEGSESGQGTTDEEGSEGGEGTTKTEGEGGEGSPDEEAGEEGKEGEEGKAKEKEVTHDPLKDTQRKLHELAQERAKLKQQILDLKKAHLKEIEPVKPQDYTEAQLADLKVDDPDRYVDVMMERREHERRVKDFQAKQKSVEDEEAAMAQETTYQNTLAGILQAAKELTGLDPDFGAGLDGQPKEIQDFINSKEFKKTDQFLTQQGSHYRQPDGSFSARTIVMAFKDINTDYLLAKARQEGGERTVQNMRTAVGAGSKLSKVPAGHRPPNPKAPKSQADFERMSEEELNSVQVAEE